MDRSDIPWLEAGRGKVDWTIEVTSIRDRLIELQSMFSSKLNELRGLDDHFAVDQKLGSIISVLQEFPALYALLHQLDVDAAGAFFDNNNGHTISYEIAIRAKAGNQLCVELCQFLNLLSENHCAWSLANESLLRLSNAG